MEGALLLSAAGLAYAAAAALYARQLRLVARAGAGRSPDLFLMALVLHVAFLLVAVVPEGLGAITGLGLLPQHFALAAAVIVVALRRKDHLGVLGAFTAPVVAIVVSATAVYLALSPVEPSLPAFERASLDPLTAAHAVTSSLGFAAFCLAYLLAGFYTLLDSRLRAKCAASGHGRLPALETLERVTYQVLAVGFVLFSTGAVLGGIGAWGQGVSEGAAIRNTLALLSWFSFAVVLSLRWLRGWTGRRAMFLVAVGFLANVAVILMYLFRMARL